MFIILFAWYSKERGNRFFPNWLNQQSMTTSQGRYPWPKHSIKPRDPLQWNSTGSPHTVCRTALPKRLQGSPGTENTAHRNSQTPRAAGGHCSGLLLSSREATQVVALPSHWPGSGEMCSVFRVVTSSLQNCLLGQRNAAPRIYPLLKEIGKGNASVQGMCSPWKIRF